MGAVIDLCMNWLRGPDCTETCIKAASRALNPTSRGVSRIMEPSTYRTGVRVREAVATSPIARMTSAEAPPRPIVIMAITDPVSAATRAFHTITDIGITQTKRQFSTIRHFGLNGRQGSVNQRLSPLSALSGQFDVKCQGSSWAGPQMRPNASSTCPTTY